jgi:hypothetical protein
VAPRAVRVLDIDELIAHPYDGPDAVAVTFDDGFQNVEPRWKVRSNGVPAAVRRVVTRAPMRGAAATSLAFTLPLLAGPIRHLMGRGVPFRRTRTHPSCADRGRGAGRQLLGCVDLAPGLASDRARRYPMRRQRRSRTAPPMRSSSAYTDFRALAPGATRNAAARDYFREPGQIGRGTAGWSRSLDGPRGRVLDEKSTARTTRGGIARQWRWGTDTNSPAG